MPVPYWDHAMSSRTAIPHATRPFPDGRGSDRDGGIMLAQSSKHATHATLPRRVSIDWAVGANHHLRRAQAVDGRADDAAGVARAFADRIEIARRDALA